VGLETSNFALLHFPATHLTLRENYFSDCSFFRVEIPRYSLNQGLHGPDFAIRLGGDSRTKFQAAIPENRESGSVGKDLVRLYSSILAATCLRLRIPAFPFDKLALTHVIMRPEFSIGVQVDI
jgi:hypothetical protein